MDNLFYTDPIKRDPDQLGMFDGPKHTDVTLMFDESGVLVVIFSVLFSKAHYNLFRVGVFQVAKLTKAVARGVCDKPDTTCVEITFQTGVKNGISVEESRQAIRAYAQVFADDLDNMQPEPEVQQLDLFSVVSAESVPAIPTPDQVVRFQNFSRFLYMENETAQTDAKVSPALASKTGSEYRKQCAERDQARQDIGINKYESGDLIGGKYALIQRRFESCNRLKVRANLERDALENSESAFRMPTIKELITFYTERYK